MREREMGLAQLPLPGFGDEFIQLPLVGFRHEDLKTLSQQTSYRFLDRLHSQLLQSDNSKILKSHGTHCIINSGPQILSLDKEVDCADTDGGSCMVVGIWTLEVPSEYGVSDQIQPLHVHDTGEIVVGGTGGISRQPEEGNMNRKVFELPFPTLEGMLQNTRRILETEDIFVD